MHRDFDDLICLAAKKKLFFLAAKNARILHKNDCERKLF